MRLLVPGAGIAFEGEAPQYRAPNLTAYHAVVRDGYPVDPHWREPHCPQDPLRAGKP